VLRQGGFFVAGHPIRAARNIADMLRAFGSEGTQLRIMKEIAGRPRAKQYAMGELQLTELHGRLVVQEEVYMSKFAKNIPIAGRVVAASERAYVTFLNLLRADAFDALAESFAPNRALTKAEAKVIGNFVNVATGRGDLGSFKMNAERLATVFFAPRFVLSRFQILTLQPLRYGGNAQMRTMIAKEYARALIGVGTFYGLSMAALNAYYGPPGRREKWNLEFDPRSSDFAKLRIGPTRIDPLFGLQQATVLISRLASGSTKNLKGRVTPIVGQKIPYGAPNAWDVIARFGRTKLSPVMGAGLNLRLGEDVVGQPVTPMDVAANMTIPIAMQDIYRAMKAQGMPDGLAISLLGVFGMSVQTYSNKRVKGAA
jgi:hypothetical protein